VSGAKRKRRSAEEIAAEKLAKAERKARAEAKARQRRAEKGARMSKAAAKGYEASLAKDRAREKAKATSEAMMDFALGKDTPEARHVGETLAKIREDKRPPKRSRGAMPFTPSPEKREIDSRKVADPYDGTPLKVAINARESPVEHMLARGMITYVQKLAGDRFRSIYEQAMIGGAKAIDYGKTKVDGGKLYDPMHESMHEASRDLQALATVLGQADYGLMLRIAGEGRSIRDVAPWWYVTNAIAISKRDELYVGRRFRDALDTLARHWGISRHVRARESA
jgi:hypothetical protein